MKRIPIPMKRLFIILPAVSLMSTVCRAQFSLPVPEQTDTLEIISMKYHHDEIRPENFPFKYIIRKPQSFTINGQEMTIKKSLSSCEDKYYWFEGIDGDLVENRAEDVIKIRFLDFEFECVTKNDKLDDKKRK